MSQSEVERHKMYEHPVPISPFEERRFVSENCRTNSKTTVEDLQRMTSDVMTGKNDNNNNNNNNDLTTVGGRQMRKVPFKTFRF